YRSEFERTTPSGRSPIPRDSSILDEGLQIAPAQGMPQLTQRLCLDLPDAFPGDRKALADFLQRVLAFLADAEAQPQDLLLLGAERRQRALHLMCQVLRHQRFVGRARRLVLEEITALRVFADRRLERERLPRRLEDEPNLLRGHARTLRELFRRRLTAHLVDHVAV